MTATQQMLDKQIDTFSRIARKNRRFRDRLDRFLPLIVRNKKEVARQHEFELSLHSTGYSAEYDSLGQRNGLHRFWVRRHAHYAHLRRSLIRVLLYLLGHPTLSAQTRGSQYMSKIQFAS